MLVMLLVVMLVNCGRRGGRSEVLGLRHCQDFLSSWERDFLERERERVSVCVKEADGWEKREL